MLNMIAASPPMQKRNNAACTPIEPIVTDLIDNLFDNECGDTVRPLAESLLMNIYLIRLYRLMVLFVSLSMMPSEFLQN